MIHANDTKQSRKKKRKRSGDGDKGGAPLDASVNRSRQSQSDATTISVQATSKTIISKIRSIDQSNQNHPLLEPQSRTSNHTGGAVPHSNPTTQSFRNHHHHTAKKYVTIHDGLLYQELLRNAYIGFSYVPAAQVSTIMMDHLDHHHHHHPPTSSSSTTDNENHYQDHFHSNYQRVLQSLYHYYQYDIIMAGGKHSSRTFVRRTLVGEPGMTYKYLGLRLFTHAWRGGKSCEDDDDVTTTKKVSKTVPAVLHSVYLLNQAMKRMTEQQMQMYQSKTGKVVPKHLYDYNITLINYMEPCNEMKNQKSTNHISQLRDEEFYGMGKASVSWHADSSLQDNSCIGVYHTLFENKLGDIPTKTQHKKISMTKRYHGNNEEFKGNDDSDWKIALRPNPTAPTTGSFGVGKKGRLDGGNKSSHNTSMRLHPTPPPIVVPTKSGDAYFLLDEFNHQFQHMVLAGSNDQYRISSTHRVAVTTTDTYEYISKACSTALLSSKAELKKSPHNIGDWDASILLQSQTVLDEVEFEWIAQYWIQGTQHDIQHVWWQRPMRALEDAWNALERVTYKIYTNIVASIASTDNEKKGSSLPSHKLAKGLLQAFQNRQELRLKWDHRRADKIYKRRISLPYQPVEHPVFPSVDANPQNGPKQLQKQLPKDLTDAIQTLSNLLQKYPPKSTEKDCKKR